jgi:hypothetical protein
MNWGHVVRNTAIAIGITFVTAVGVYLAIRLVVSARGFLEVNALFPETDGVCLDYRAYDGTVVRTHFTFTKTGKLRHTVCAPLKKPPERIAQSVNRLAPYKGGRVRQLPSSYRSISAASPPSRQASSLSTIVPIGSPSWEL